MADQQSKLTFNQVKDKLALPIAYSVLDISDETEKNRLFPNVEIHHSQSGGLDSSEWWIHSPRH